MAKKQAVLLIHGIGEQRPMQTLRGFVEAVWVTDTSAHNQYGKPNVWSKPDTISGSFELRRLTTGRNRTNIRTDFFEFYWAHLMSGNSVAHVLAWTKLLLLRPPWKVPPQLRGAWFALVIIALVVLALFVQTALPEERQVVPLPAWLTGAGGALLAVVAVPIIKSIVGDAARYLNPAPTNIKRRQEIRAKGVALLQKLHDCGEYDRIIVVGHSLGSVIGYDILTYAWAMHNESGDDAIDHPKLDALEAGVVDGTLEGEAFRAAQRAAFDEAVQRKGTWRVTDFITCGSPLAHADLLLAADLDDLRAKETGREFPTCPPELEEHRFSYPANAPRRTPHHAAVFGFTRWTNLYFPARFMVFGDFIGGPLARRFGTGVRDVAVSTRRHLGLLSHKLYWRGLGRGAAPSHIEALRDAVNLVDE